MAVVFLISLIGWLAVAAYSILLKRRFIGVNLFVLGGIYLPMAFYFLGWSDFVDNSPANEFYFIFICLNVCLILFNVLVRDTCEFDLAALPTAVSAKAVILIDLFYIGLFLFESYLGSGSLAPALAGIDIHTYSAPIIAFITRNLFAFISVNLAAFFVTHKKGYLGAAFVLLALPVVTRSMRITAIIALLQAATFFGLYYLAVRRNKVRDDEQQRAQAKRNKVLVVGAVVIAVLFVAGSAALTNDRMNQYGKYDYLDYSTEIHYTGPEVLHDVLPVYYGYFPMSFSNLNLSLKYGSTEHNYVGLYSFKSLYFGVFQFDNIFGLDPSEPDLEGNRVNSTPAATVATAFWDYWYDYGYLCFIPILAMLLICAWITQRLQARPSLFMYFQYSYFIPLVFFESFQNVFYGCETLFEVAISFVLIKLAFSAEKTGAGASGKGFVTATSERVRSLIHRTFGRS